MLPFTRLELADALQNGEVTARRHPTLPYTIYNYSAEVQWLNSWNEVTLNCRGLILDDDFNIVARPWKKFFNLGQVNLPMQFDDPVEVMDKADGSLGILYPLKSPVYSGHHDYAIATRGSFESTQAVAASKLWSERYDGLHPMQDYTMLFEILLPWNRIVLNYFHGQHQYVQEQVARNDTGEHVYSSEQGLEDLSSVPFGSAEAQRSEESRKGQEEFSEMESGESGTLSRTRTQNVSEDSGDNSRSQERCAVCGLRTGLSSGSNGLRPSAGNGSEGIQYQSNSQSSEDSGRDSEVRDCVCELPQGSNLRHTQGELVLLGAVQNSTGYYISPTVAKNMFYIYDNGVYTEYVWPGPVVEVMPYKSISEALAHTDRPNAEGYVIRSHNFMVKLKQPDYLELHRLVTNASPKTVWEQLKAGKSKSEIVSAFPDEFHDYIGSMVDPLLERYEERCQQIFSDWSKVMDSLYGTNASRKDYARAFSKSKDQKYYFLLLDSKPIASVVWAELRPKEAV